MKEKIKYIYTQMGIDVEENYIDKIMEDKQRVKEFMRLYREEEIKKMNYIFNKPQDNRYFTEFELRILQGVNLQNNRLVDLIKKMWAQEMGTAKGVKVWKKLI